jgi:hypothetical protein
VTDNGQVLGAVSSLLDITDRRKQSRLSGTLMPGSTTFMAVPLTARGVTLGVALLGRAEHPEPYNEADVRLVSDLASRAAVHIDNARLYTREHDAAVTLQRSLLPRDIPPVAGLDIAYRYQPASRAAQVGGDWFDVIPLDGGQAALVVGDVTGRSMRVGAGACSGSSPYCSGPPGPQQVDVALPGRRHYRMSATVSRIAAIGAYRSTRFNREIMRSRSAENVTGMPYLRTHDICGWQRCDHVP